jgi:hypothetical protein
MKAIQVFLLLSIYVVVRALLSTEPWISSTARIAQLVRTFPICHQTLQCATSDEAKPLSNSEFSEYHEKWEAEERQRMVAEEKERQLLEGDEYEMPAYIRAIMKELGKAEEAEAVSMGKLPTLVIMGRPNTGKSTLVNKITDSYKDGAIVHGKSTTLYKPRLSW